MLSGKRSQGLPGDRRQAIVVSILTDQAQEFAHLRRPPGGSGYWSPLSRG
jgi:hypothetical protein